MSSFCGYYIHQKKTYESIDFCVQYTESQEERIPISTWLLNSGQVKGGLLLHFSASELEQTVFPEERMLWSVPPDICVNST